MHEASDARPAAAVSAELDTISRRNTQPGLAVDMPQAWRASGAARQRARRCAWAHTSRGMGQVAKEATAVLEGAMTPGVGCGEVGPRVLVTQTRMPSPLARTNDVCLMLTDAVGGMVAAARAAATAGI